MAKKLTRARAQQQQAGQHVTPPPLARSRVMTRARMCDGCIKIYLFLGEKKITLPKSSELRSLVRSFFLGKTAVFGYLAHGFDNRVAPSVCSRISFDLGGIQLIASFSIRWEPQKAK